MTTRHKIGRLYHNTGPRTDASGKRYSVVYGSELNDTKHVKELEQKYNAIFEPSTSIDKHVPKSGFDELSITHRIARKIGNDYGKNAEVSYGTHGTSLLKLKSDKELASHDKVNTVLQNLGHGLSFEPEKLKRKTLTVNGIHVKISQDQNNEKVHHLVMNQNGEIDPMKLKYRI